MHVVDLGEGLCLMQSLKVERAIVNSDSKKNRLLEPVFFVT